MVAFAILYLLQVVEQLIFSPAPIRAIIQNANFV